MMLLLQIDIQSYYVQALPKTRSGKILRKTIRSIINKEQWTMPPTVENPNVFDDCKIALKNFNII